MRTRVKICGITSVEDAQVAASCGVDAIGLVFVKSSPRFVEVEAAADIAASVPAFVSVVGLFLDHDEDYVEHICSHVSLDLLQFHGSEAPDYCQRFNRPFIKALGMRGNIAAASQIERYEGAKGYLLDSHAPGESGGTGERFDWSSLGQTHNFPLILAGGITPDNVAEAIRTVRPWGVDLSSGVESSPGVKDHEKMVALMNEVMSVDCK